jgi:broad specificity phosphatase PhoE
MTGLRWMLALLLCALGGTIAIAADPASPTIYVMRHLNTPEGVPDPDLTAEGKASAVALVHWFHGKPLKAIYVSDYRRTRQTAAPLAADRGITVTLYDPRDTPALIARVRAEGGAVLIVGHSNTVPDVVEKLGGERPTDLAHADFGDVWAIAGGRATRGKLPTGS